jgi:hypothetical protein
MLVKNTSYRITFLILIIFLFLLTGCNGSSGTPKPTATPEATAVPPTSTSAPAEIVWVSGQPDAVPALSTAISDFAAANSLQYRTAAALDSSGITSGTKIVVFESAPANLAELSAAASTTQFVVLGNTATAGGNVSVIQTSAVDEAFMAGYLTMLIAEDWRAAALIPTTARSGMLTLMLLPMAQSMFAASVTPSMPRWWSCP